MPSTKDVDFGNVVLKAMQGYRGLCTSLMVGFVHAHEYMWIRHILRLGPLARELQMQLRSAVVFECRSDLHGRVPGVI